MKYKYSIKRQFAIIFIGLMAGTILLCWFLNSIFLEKYYVQNKEADLKNAYASINYAAERGTLSSKGFYYEFQKICATYNMNIIVMDAESKLILSSVNDYKRMITQLLESAMGMYVPDKILEETENFIIQKSFDEETNSNYIEMWGVLENGNLFLLRSSVESIRDSVKISNQFLAYVGIGAVIISAFVTMTIAGRVTKPILQLAKISERMKNLDFEAKYSGNDKNEIGILGDHINQLSDTLEKTISELKTANNELKNDIHQKEKIDEMRKEFLSNVSHELKTPIALIMGYAEGLKIGINEDDSSRDFYCDVIMDEAGKMNTMVKKLLTLNQLEFGNDVVTMERFDLHELIKNYIQSADILIKQNGVKVEFQCDGPVYVWGDEFKVEEVFMNYFTNAMNYAMGEKRINIKIRRQADKVRTTVFNTGKPIPEESLPLIWGKFYKVDKARTREYGGSGVGLSIVKAIMESMNQEYGVVNYENGVEFWFELAAE